MRSLIEGHPTYGAHESGSSEAHTRETTVQHEHDGARRGAYLPRVPAKKSPRARDRRTKQASVLDPALEALIPERARLTPAREPSVKITHDVRDPRAAPSAHRPLRAQGAGRRALTNVGGAVERHGDEALSAIAAQALMVRAGEGDATLTHPFHAYPARMHPETARTLCEFARAQYGEEATVLDPFCGSGTVLVEAFALGIPAWGTDLSSLAVELSRVKTRRTTVAMRRELVNAARATARVAERLLADRVPCPVPDGEAEWFAPSALAEVAALTEAVEQIHTGFVRDACRMLLSSLLVKASRQRADSALDKVDKRVPSGWLFAQFARKALELSHGLTAMARAAPAPAPEPVVRIDDATHLSGVRPSSIRAVISSPPYANTYDYAAHHARRYAWLRLDAAPIARDELGAARWFEEDPAKGVTRFARDLDALCGALARVLTPDGLAFLLVGDGAADGRPLRADEDFARAAATAGLLVAARASQTRPSFDEATDRAFRRSPKREHLLVLRRASVG